MDKDILCSCGKSKGNLNQTNWLRHLKACSMKRNLPVQQPAT